MNDASGLVLSVDLLNLFKRIFKDVCISLTSVPLKIALDKLTRLLGSLRLVLRLYRQLYLLVHQQRKIILNQMQVLQEESLPPTPTEISPTSNAHARAACQLPYKT